jgi:hypothetical protein
MKPPETGTRPSGSLMRSQDSVRRRTTPAGVPVASLILNPKTRKREGEWMKVGGVQKDVPHVENGTEDPETTTRLPCCRTRSGAAGDSSDDARQVCRDADRVSPHTSISPFHQPLA